MENTPIQSENVWTNLENYKAPHVGHKHNQPQHLVAHKTTTTSRALAEDSHKTNGEYLLKLSKRVPGTFPMQQALPLRLLGSPTTISSARRPKRQALYTFPQPLRLRRLFISNKDTIFYSTQAPPPTTIKTPSETTQCSEGVAKALLFWRYCWMRGIHKRKGVGEAVGVKVAVGLGVTVGVAVGVAVGCAVGVAEAVGVGQGVGEGTCPEGNVYSK